MPEQNIITKSPRYIFIDVMRAIAVFWMLKAHVVNACLSDGLRQNFLYYLEDLSNGFVAISFIFCAGAGFFLAARKRLDDYKSFRMPFWIYLRRMGIILFLAYWLHLPEFSFSKMFHLTNNQLIYFFECDVLQNIVAASLITLVILLILRSITIFPYVCGVLALFIFLFTPAIWDIDIFNFLPKFFAAYLEPKPISKFPLFYWGGYFFAGVALTALFFKIENKKRFSKIAFFISLSFLLFLYFTRNNMFATPNPETWWQGSIPHSFFRLFGITSLFFLLYLFEEPMKNFKYSKILSLFGQESLFVYVGHLIVVYGSVINPNFSFRYFWNHSIGVFPCILLTLLLIAAFLGLSWLWKGLKTKNLPIARAIMATSAFVFLIIFFVRN